MQHLMTVLHIRETYTQAPKIFLRKKIIFCLTSIFLDDIIVLFFKFFLKSKRFWLYLLALLLLALEQY